MVSACRLCPSRVFHNYRPLDATAGEVKIRKEGASLRKPDQMSVAASQEAHPRWWGAGQVKKIRRVGNQGNRCGDARLWGGSS